MSSSETQAIRFLKNVFIILALLISVFIFLSLLIDPFDLRAQKHGNLLYKHDGSTSNKEHIFIPLLGFYYPAKELITGTSKIKYGFQSAYWPTPSTVVNLGIDGQNIIELEKWLPTLIEKRSYDKIWLGLDFGMFFSHLDSSRINSIPDLMKNKSLLKLYYQVGPKAWPESYRAIISHSCQQPFRDHQGFDNSCKKFTVVNKRMQTRFAKHLEAYNAHPLKNTLIKFERIIQQAINKGTKINIFLNPSDPGYYKSVQMANKTALFLHWKTELGKLIKIYQQQSKLIQFRDFSDLYQNEQNYQQLCQDRESNTCPFYDLTHYKPFVGKLIFDSFKNN